jgi:FeS assembly SUF system regulator
MLRMSKLTDYGIVLLTHLARDRAAQSATARDLSEASHLPFPTVGKLLKELSQAGLLTSHRGVNGGYALARTPERISVAEIITALEGPIALTECGEHGGGTCQLESQCPVSGNWKTISRTIREALEKLSLAQLANDGDPSTHFEVSFERQETR